MSMRTIPVLVTKDLTLFFRNRLFAVISVLILIAYGVVFYLMPSTVDETLEIGLYSPQVPVKLIEYLEDEGLLLKMMDSEDALKEAMLAGDYNVGAVLPGDFMSLLSTGKTPLVHLYFTADLPQDLHEAYVILFQELAFIFTGQPLEVEATEEVLGTDMVGVQIPPRQRMVPLFAIFVLMIETLGLSSLLATEVEKGTHRALLVTPLSLPDFFFGKATTAVGLAFVQAALLTAIIGGLRYQPLLILFTLFLGAVLVTGVGFLLAAAGKDMMSVMAWGIMAVLILCIPAFGLIIPGLVTGWVKLIPSYYLVDTFYRVTNLNAGWADVWANLLILIGFDLVLLWLGVVALRRKLK